MGAVSRSGYSDDLETWALICWRGAVKKAITGSRGQALLREMLIALDAMPAKRLISRDLIKEGEVCALGAVAAARGLDVSAVDPEDRDTVAGVFNIAPALAAEIVYENDETWTGETPEERYARMREWVAANLKQEVSE